MQTTAMRTKTPSPAVKWLEKTGRLEGPILDFGAGYGRNSTYLRDQGYRVYSYDPVHGSSVSGWTGVSNVLPDFERFNTILTVFVLNTVRKWEEKEIRDQINSEWGDIAYHVVRNNDLLKDHSLFQALEGFKTSRGFQRHVTGAALKVAPNWRIL